MLISPLQEIYPNEPVPGDPCTLASIPPKNEPVPLELIFPLQEINPNKLVLPPSASNPLLALILLALTSTVISAPATVKVSVVLI